MSELGFTWTDEGEFGVYIRVAALSGGLGRKASDFEARVLRRIDHLEERNTALQGQLNRRRDSILAPLRAHVRELRTSLRTITFARYSDLTMADVERIALAALATVDAEKGEP